MRTDETGAAGDEVRGGQRGKPALGIPGTSFNAFW
jgi:hypothetical protein